MRAIKRAPLHTGSMMPIIGLGTWQLDNHPVQAILNALALGYRMIDTSGDYGTQEAVGEAVRRSGIHRSSIYIVTKVEEDEDAYKAAQKNLKELGMDYIDLILIHRPPQFDAGQDLWQSLIRAKKDGIVRDIGVSNYSIEEIEELIEDSGIVPVVNQIEWSPFGHRDEMYDYARENDILIQAYSPLTRGERLNDQVLNILSRKYRKSPAQIMLRWNIQLGITLLPKANKGEHQKENLSIFDFRLSDEDMLALHNRNEQYSALSSELQYI